LKRRNSLENRAGPGLASFIQVVPFGARLLL
jgi:hypothetical protein